VSIIKSSFSYSHKHFLFSVINNSQTQVSKDSSELQPNESLSLRCILNERNNSNSTNNDNASLWSRLKAKLSVHCIQSLNELQSEIFQMLKGENYLIRHETKFFPFSQANITNEDLNSLLHANNKHMTICLNWKASISDNGTFLRHAFGQHFVQIDNLFES
jgi:hypothetical protein